jgi:hypothetical protein
MIPRPRAPRVRRSTIALILTVAALAFPLGVLANHQFNDVPTAASYHDDVEALVDAGITTGCGGGNYCPGQAVTRGQMAQFLNRLGSLDGDSDPSVNARTAQQVDGWSIDCPANTVFSQGKCFDNAVRGTASSIYDAADACAAIFVLGGHSWHLPAALELRAIRGISGITLDNEWSSTEFFDDANQWQGFRVADSGALTAAGDLTDASYRCATYPYSADFTIIIPLDETEAGDAAAGGATD